MHAHTHTHTHEHTHTHTHTHAHAHTHTHTHTHTHMHMHTHTHTHAAPHQVGGEVVVPLVLKHQLSKYDHIPKWGWGHIHEHAPAGRDRYLLSLLWDGTRRPRVRVTPTTLAVGTISSDVTMHVSLRHEGTSETYHSNYTIMALHPMSYNDS